MDALHGVRIFWIRFCELRSLHLQGSNRGWWCKSTCDSLARILRSQDAVLFRCAGDSVFSSESKCECPALPEWTRGARDRELLLTLRPVRYAHLTGTRTIILASNNRERAAGIEPSCDLHSPFCF